MDVNASLSRVRRVHSAVRAVVRSLPVLEPCTGLLSYA